MLIKARELKIHEDHPKYSKFVLHMYAQDIHVKCRNEKILNDIDEQLYFSKARDSVWNDITNLAEFTLPMKPSETGSLEETLLIKVVPE